MSTEAVQKIYDNNSINKSDNKMGCAPRNALFCCSSPVCLNSSTVPRILPVDYQQCETSKKLLIIPSAIQQQQQKEKIQESQEIIVPLSDDVQKRISTYDFPICCEKKISIQPIQHSISATPLMAFSNQTCHKTIDNATNSLEISNNPSDNCRKESNSSTFGTRNEFDLKVNSRSSTSSISLSSSSPSESPPPLQLASSVQKQKPSKAINELARILSTENLNNNNYKTSAQQKHPTNYKFTPMKGKCCCTPTNKLLEQNEKLVDNISSMTILTKLPFPEDSSDLYSAEIDYMNNYLKSLPDYNELDKKIHKEFKKCEDIYDQIQNINTGISEINQPQIRLIPESNSHANKINQISFPAHQQLKLASKASDKSFSDEDVKSEIIKSATNNNTNYPSIFSGGIQNKLTRSISSSNMSTQNYPIDHPDILGFLPKLPQNTSGNLFRFNNGGIQKSSSNSCLMRPMGKKLMNEFWSENIVDKNKKKTGWNYEKIIIASPSADSKKGFTFPDNVTKSDTKVKKIRKDLSLSSIDSKIRENVSKEDLYKLICNDSSEDQKLKVALQQKVPAKIKTKDIGNIPGFMNLNKNISLSNMSGIPKSLSKSHIPCYTKQLPPLSKSTSNSQLPLRQIYSNQIVGEKNSNRSSAGVTNKELQAITPFKGVFKSTSNSSVFGNKYQPFQFRKNGPPSQLLVQAPVGDDSCKNYEKMTRSNDASRSAVNNKQLKANSTVLKAKTELEKDYQKIQSIVQPAEKYDSSKQICSKKYSENTPLARLSSSLHISIGGKYQQQPNEYYKNLISYQSLSNAPADRLLQNQSFKAQNEANLDNSKKQKEAENNIEKCLNEMLKVTSNYNAPTPTIKPTESQQSCGVSGHRVQHHKPFPIGKSNSTSNVQQHHYHPVYHDAYIQMRNKKQMPIWNAVSDHKNFQKVVSIIPQGFKNAGPVNYQQSHPQQKLSAVNMPSGLQKSATSGNIRKDIGSNKTYGNGDVYNVVNSTAPCNSLYGSSCYTGPCPIRKQTSSTASKIYTFESNDTKEAIINNSQNNITFPDDKRRSDVLQTFDPFFYRNQQPLGILTKNKALPDVVQGDEVEKFSIAGNQNLPNLYPNQISLNKPSDTSGSTRQNQPPTLVILPPARHPEMQQHQPLLRSSLVEYENLPSTISQSSTYFDSSCDMASSAEHYFEQPKPTIQDDADGHLIYHTGDILHSRYKIMATLGEGTFGRVVKVKDMERDHCMALKIIKNVEKYREAAKLEINALEKISQKDPNCDHLCVRMIDWFDYHGHMCIAFEMLGLSVFDFLRENNYEPYPLDQVRHMGYQLCYAVKFLHENRLTHTDLKPENILFVDSEYTTHYNHKKNREVRRVKCTDVRLIDFGSATFDHEHHSTIVSTRHYRAPEVILELGWSQPCDVWSIGCILFELYLGITLFQTHDNREHLAMMERILGQIPYRMARKTKTKYFYHGKLDWDEKSSAGRYVRDHCKPLFRYLMSDSEDHMQLFDLIKKMLEYEPSQRITLNEALRHPFFEKLPPHQRISDMGKVMSSSSSRERSHSLSR